MIDLRKFPVAPVLACISAMALATAGDVSEDRKTWAELMGKWRMTGQAKRGSSQGAWTSPASADWATSPDARRITFSIPESGSFRSMSVRIDPKTGDAVGIELQMPKSDPRNLVRIAESRGDSFVFEETGTPGRESYRLTLVRKARDRWTGTLELRKSGSSNWSRLQELGMTRQGTTIAQGSGQPECVVTGGLGEIAVTVNGKTVYVCCSGCRETLLADPDAFLKPAGKPKESPAAPAGSQSP